MEAGRLEEEIKKIVNDVDECDGVEMKYDDVKLWTYIDKNK